MNQNANCILLAVIISVSCNKSESASDDWGTEENRTSDDTGTFRGGGGESQEIPDNTDSPDDGDSGMVGGDDTGSPPVGDPPVISSVSASWGTGDSSYLLIDITVTDPDDDINNGRVGIAIDELSEQWFNIHDTEDPEAPDQIPAPYYKSENKVSALLEDIDPSGPTPTIMVRVKDAEMNPSEAVQVNLTSEG